MVEAVTDDPVSNCMQKIVKDPATIKIFTTIFSGILIHNSVAHSRGDWSAVPLVVIFSACFLYSVITLLIVLFKKQEDVAQCRILKAIFCGRNIYWNEIQTYLAYTLATINVSGLVLINENAGQGIQATFCAFNLVMFAAEWYIAATKNKTYVNVENPKLTISCWKCFMGIFTKCPLFYNLVRTTCLIVALLLLMTYSNFEGHTYYYIYCISYAICASVTLFILQIFTNSSSSSGKKGQTYMMLIITAHVFLAILSLSLVAEYKPVSKTIPKWKNVGVPHDFKNSWKVNENNQNKAFDKNEQLAFSTTISPPLTTWYIGRSSHAEIFHAPSCCPITYGLTCFVLILSILDLYVRAIFSETQYQNNCEPEHEEEKTVSFSVNEEVKNIDDLKINVALPQMFDEPNKQHFLV